MSIYRNLDIFGLTGQIFTRPNRSERVKIYLSPFEIYVIIVEV